MKILITNDDGYQAKGLKALIEILQPLGDLTIVAPKQPQSGMSMAVTMGYVPIAVKHIGDIPGQSWWYLDGTPASCVKFGIDNVFYPDRPDLVVSGINHGSNAATASIYSGTVGAAMEGAVNGIPSVGVSLDSFDPEADFTVVKELFPKILEVLMKRYTPRFGAFYNVNFPAIPASEVKGVRVCSMGMGHWEKEYQPYDPKALEARGHKPRKRDLYYYGHAEPGEEMYVMLGEFVDNDGNTPSADHLLLEQGFITITPENIDNTDYAEIQRLCDII